MAPDSAEIHISFEPVFWRNPIAWIRDKWAMYKLGRLIRTVRGYETKLEIAEFRGRNSDWWKWN